MSTAETPVRFLDLGAEFAELKDDWFTAIEGLGAKGAFVLGEQVERFESAFAAAVGVPHAVSVANGTDALILSLEALGIGPGDEVITTPYTFFASAEAISRVGATPVFADLDADTFNLDPAQAETLINAKTRAIMPVHLFGCPVDMRAIATLAERHGLAVVEDAAQAYGASVGERRVGSLGDCGAFSFYPTKVLGCYGDGGMISCHSAEVAERLRKARNHAATAPFMHDGLGYNSRLDAIQAALLEKKLGRVEADIEGRRAVADTYDAGLAGSPVTSPPRPDYGRHVFNLYTVRTPARDALREHLSEQQIPSSLCYPLPLHLQPVYTHLGYQPGQLPVAEKASTEALSLPIYPGMPRAAIERVARTVRDFFA